MRVLSSLALCLVLLAGCSSTQDSIYGRTGNASRDYPASARASGGGQERYVLCHNGKTKTLPVSAVEAHRRHGDRFGACRRDGRGQGNGRGNR